MTVRDNLKITLNAIPKKPGVYFFRDFKGKIIYIGKARNLFDRVKSYFISSEKSWHLNHPISFFTDKIHSIDFTVTDNETEALILESSLIKKNRPKYNVFLKDDKSYPYIAITENEKFPRVFVTRNRNIKGAKYFGPYVNVKNIKDTLELLRRIFQIRDCKKPLPGKLRNSVCLNYHIKLCSAPCAGKISEENYRKNIDYIKLFLKGRDKKIIDGLKKEMEKYCAALEFEEANKIKNKISAINSLYTDQKIFFDIKDSWDVISYARDDDENMSAVSLFNYKNGEFSAVNNFIISNTRYSFEGEIISGFIKNFYPEIDNISPNIYIPCMIEDRSAISEWLKNLKGKKINFIVPKQGEKKDIMDMATKNARLFLEKKKFEKNLGYSKVFSGLVKMRDFFSFGNIPARIECFDISNILSSFTVGSMAVFVNGSSLNSNYRNFRIRSVEGQDDFAMIKEVVKRRLRYLVNEKIGIEDSFGTKPDLFVIDGGKAQYNSAKQALKEAGINNIDIVSLAKKEERVFCEKYPSGIVPDKNLEFMKILIRIRDEAHRFALDYHRKLRGKGMTVSVLDGIKGIGEKKKNNILAKYPTLEDLKGCSLEDFTNIRGLAYKDALNIYNSLNRY
ncbi:MAG: excinuclease ABC subunit UvrC [Actinobacteria bacterium]|nr:excinuclease ABC subunit UvrC [Actinomycetota bacterium]